MAESSSKAYALRLIYSPSQAGTLNMATDQAIMEAVGDGKVPPTLRFYQWSPPCLSLGYAQPIEDVDINRVLSKGWGIVRRPTGGRAILHTDELTYSISFPQDHPLVAGDILTSYQRLSQALTEGLIQLGMEIETAPRDKRGEQNAVCFVVPSAYEITAQHKKLIGSAQVRRQKAVLQHGSLPLHGDLGRICDALAFPDDLQREAAKEQVRDRATTIQEILGKTITWEQAAQAIQRGFEIAFDIEFENQPLTPEESLRIEQLKSEVYGSDNWTQKR